MTRIAAVQCDASDRSGVLAQLDAACDSGADLVVLPEYASGWAPTITAELAAPEDDQFVAHLRDVAGGREVAIVAGILVPTSPGRAANLTLAIGSDGRVAGRYQKIHRFDAFGVRESDVLDAGDGAQVDLIDVPTRRGALRVGLATCYDLRFPESFRAILDSSSAAPDLFVVGAAWAKGPGKAEQLRLLARARALENTTPLALASQSGAGRVGGSAVLDALGGVLCQVDDGVDAGSHRVGVAVAEVAIDATERVRDVLPVLGARQFRVIPR